MFIFFVVISTGGCAMSSGSLQSGATSPMSCMSVESHDTFQSGLLSMIFLVL